MWNNLEMIGRWLARIYGTFMKPEFRAREWELDVLRSLRDAGIKTKIMETSLLDTWQDSSMEVILHFAKVTLWIENTHSSNTLSFQILATPDHDYSENIALLPWTVLKSETMLDPGKDTFETLTDPWDAIKIQAKNAYAGSTADILAYVIKRRY